MGQKVNPIGMRLGISQTWNSNWYAKNDYAALLYQDNVIKEYLHKNLRHAGIASIKIERANTNLKIHVFSARPGIIIGRKGEEAEKTRKKLVTLTGQKELSLNIREVRRPEVEAQLVADNIALQLERRAAFRRVIKKSVQNIMRFNAQGCKIMVSGRLNGADMARTEWTYDGKLPLHTLRSSIDYAVSEAKTIYGIIGIKVWIYKKENTSNVRRKRPNKPDSKGN